MPLPVVTAIPAPVWEESDIEKDLAVRELSKNVTDVNNEINQTASILVAQNQTTTSTIMSTTVESILETEDKDKTTINDNANVAKEDENSAQNSTQLNNLNVTVYEISSHGSNNSILITKPLNPQSTEYEDHEPEMNPFLPEVENNKILVKKLQEGHDIEPINLNETQMKMLKITR